MTLCGCGCTTGGGLGIGLGTELGIIDGLGRGEGIGLGLLTGLVMLPNPGLPKELGDFVRPSRKLILHGKPVWPISDVVSGVAISCRLPFGAPISEAVSSRAGNSKM